MAKGKKGTGVPAKIRSAYLIYEIEDGKLKVIEAVRSAERAMDLIEGKPLLLCHRFAMN